MLVWIFFQPKTVPVYITQAVAVSFFTYLTFFLSCCTALNTDFKSQWSNTRKDTWHRQRAKCRHVSLSSSPFFVFCFLHCHHAPRSHRATSCPPALPTEVKASFLARKFKTASLNERREGGSKEEGRPAETRGREEGRKWCQRLSQSRKKTVHRPHSHTHTLAHTHTNKHARHPLPPLWCICHVEKEQAEKKGQTFQCCDLLPRRLTRQTLRRHDRRPALFFVFFCVFFICQFIAGFALRSPSPNHSPTPSLLADSRSPNSHFN